jgi:hypothetical protein
MFGKRRPEGTRALLRMIQAGSLDKTACEIDPQPTELDFTAGKEVVKIIDLQ